MLESNITALEAIAVPTAVLPKSRALSSPTTAVMPSKVFNSAAVADIAVPSKLIASKYATPSMYISFHCCEELPKS